MNFNDPIVVARFWSKVDVLASNQCWEWKGATKQPSGYGRFGKLRAHRAAYVIAKGEIEDGLVIRHSCHNRLCCNPRHLKPGTPADNSKDMVDAGRQAQGPRHGRSRFSEEDVLYIRKSSKAGAQLAREFDCSESAIS